MATHELIFLSLSLFFFSSRAPLLLVELWHNDKLHRGKEAKRSLLCGAVELYCVTEKCFVYFVPSHLYQ